MRDRVSVACLIADAAPFVLMRGRVQNLSLRTPRGTERPNSRRLDRRDGWRNERAYGRRTNRRQVDRAAAERLHFAIDATTDARGVGFCGQKNRKTKSQHETHDLFPRRRLSRQALARYEIRF